MEKSLHSFQQPSERLVFLFPVMVACDAFLLQWALQRLTGVLHVFALTCAQFGTGATGRRPGCPSALMECEDKGVSGRTAPCAGHCLLRTQTGLFSSPVAISAPQDVLVGPEVKPQPADLA